MTIAQPLDLYNSLVTTLSGSLTIFLALALLAIAGLSAMFRMSGVITLVSFALFVVLLAAVTGNLFILVMIVTGLLVFWGISKIFR